MHLWGETGKKSLKNVSIDGLEYLSLFSTGIQDPKTSNLTKTWSTTMIALCMHIYGAQYGPYGGGDDGICYIYMMMVTIIQRSFIRLTFF